jgi:hypothetical protein
LLSIDWKGTKGGWSELLGKVILLTMQFAVIIIYLIQILTVLT